MHLCSCQSPHFLSSAINEETSQNISAAFSASPMAGGVYGSSKSSKSSKRSLRERLTDDESRESSGSKGSSDQNSGNGSGHTNPEGVSDSSSGHGNVWAINFQEVRRPTGGVAVRPSSFFSSICIAKAFFEAQPAVSLVFLRWILAVWWQLALSASFTRAHIASDMWLSSFCCFQNQEVRRIRTG